MATLDIILLALFIPGVILGLTKGLVAQVVSLISVVAGVILAGRYSPDLTEVAMLQFGTEAGPTHVVCFILIFLVCVLVFALIGILITKLFKIATLGWLNRLLGMAFGIFTTAIVLGMLISVFEGLNANWNIVEAEKLADLKVWPVLRDFASGILPQLKVFVGQYLNPETAECVHV
ncbi:MAG: CvpA family protein [Bacteroidales bacterium]|nr:CvpA family protein [Bacteroidales bacterium]